GGVEHLRVAAAIPDQESAQELAMVGSLPVRHHWIARLGWIAGLRGRHLYWTRPVQEHVGPGGRWSVHADSGGDRIRIPLKLHSLPDTEPVRRGTRELEAPGFSLRLDGDFGSPRAKGYDLDSINTRPADAHGQGAQGPADCQRLGPSVRQHPGADGAVG